MKISVCIPTYNGAQYISQCLESVCKQTVTDFEIIISDDCSSDNTVEIVKTFQQNDSRIKLFVNEKNLGLIGNWNRCIEFSSGEWIKFVFQDDIIKKNCVEKFLSILLTEAQLIICKREYIFEEGLEEKVILSFYQLKRTYHVLPQTSVSYISPDELCRFMVHHVPINFIGEPTAIMFTRQCIKKYGGFNSDITNLMDLEFALRIGVNEGLIYIPEELIQFRVHTSAASQTNYSLKHFAAEYSDKIALYYILLHDPQYVNFRKYNTGTDLLRIKILMYYKAYRARRFIRKNNNAPDLLSEFAQLNEHYKGIAEFANSRFLFLPIDIYFSVTSRIHHYFNLRNAKINTGASKV